MSGTDEHTEFGRALIASMIEAAAILKGQAEAARIHLPDEASEGPVNWTKPGHDRPSERLDSEFVRGV